MEDLLCGKQLEVEIDEQIASHYMLPPSRDHL